MEQTEANPVVKQTSLFVVVPTQPTQTKQSIILRAPEDIPAEIQKRAAADWQAHLDGKDLSTLRNQFNSEHTSAQDRFDYGFAIARLQYPEQTRAQKARNWKRNAPRTARRAAA